MKSTATLLGLLVLKGLLWALQAVRVDRKPPAIEVKVDEAPQPFNGWTEASHDVIGEGRAVFVGEGHWVPEFEFTRDR